MSGRYLMAFALSNWHAISVDKKPFQNQQIYRAWNYQKFQFWENMPKRIQIFPYIRNFLPGRIRQHPAGRDPIRETMAGHTFDRIRKKRKNSGY